MIVKSFMPEVTRLENGLTVATREMPHMASVSLGLWVNVGGRYEPVELCGVSHFIEHMLFKGTRRRSARQISQDVEGIGGYLNAFTSEENTCFFSRAQHDRFEELLEVIMDMFLNSKFDPADIDKERNVIKEELAMYLDNPQHRVHELLNETLWPDQPLGRSLTGTAATLDALTRDRLLDYQGKNYVAPAILIAAAGNLKHSVAVKSARRYASKFRGGRRPFFAPATNQQQQPRARLFTKDVEQTQVALGIRACSRHDERRFALRLLNTILGENMSSRLFQVVREDLGLVYSIHSSLSLFDDVGTLTVAAGLEAGKLSRMLKLTMQELRRLARQPPALAELRRARDYLIGQLELSLESTENQMMWLGEHLLGYGKAFSPDEVKQRLSEVRAGQIRQAARDFFRPERMSLAVVSPLKTDRGLVKLLGTPQSK